MGTDCRMVIVDASVNHCNFGTLAENLLLMELVNSCHMMDGVVGKDGITRQCEYWILRT
jgi:hypothetical protein